MTTSTIPTSALDGDWDSLNATLRDDYEIEIFEQRLTAKTLDILKEYGDEITLVDVDYWTDEFAECAAISLAMPEEQS